MLLSKIPVTLLRPKVMAAAKLRRTVSGEAMISILVFTSVRSGIATRPKHLLGSVNDPGIPGGSEKDLFR